MSAIIFMLPCSDIILRYVVLVYCLEAKVLSRRQPSYKKKFVVLLFLFLIIGSNELYTFLIWLLVLIKTCFELYCYPSVYYHPLLPKTKKIITDFPIGPSMKLCQETRCLVFTRDTSLPSWLGLQSSQSLCKWALESGVFSVVCPRSPIPLFFY